MPFLETVARDNTAVVVETVAEEGTEEAVALARAAVLASAEPSGVVEVARVHPAV